MIHNQKLELELKQQEMEWQIVVESEVIIYSAIFFSAVFQKIHVQWEKTK